jgi:hypothetical protein
MTCNPFEGDTAIRIEKAVRDACSSGHMLSVGDVLIALRTDPSVTNDDFSQFARALIGARLGFAVDRWVTSIIEGE